MEKIKFVIDKETPSKKNSRINLRNGISIPSKRYKDWHDYAAILVVKQKIEQGIEQITSSCKMQFVFTHGDLRRRDSDNGVSSIMDLLVDCKILKDDNWQIVESYSVKNCYNKGKPCCEIIIEVIEEEKCEN
ncbi:MAG: RusA family crossover junction endodeoxyribonuclease [Bacteroidales bacterium]|nr:RusA family crossover junction endodeoxyribonuclease [Candidatus Scybalousia scybalohippi]